MVWSPVPDLTSAGRLARAAFALAALVLVVRAVTGYAAVRQSLGDTDDALRLRIVRDLLAGRGWFDTHIDRLQPPAGFDIHWSRLVDGGLAALNALFGFFLAPETAELAMRLVWPLLWVFPLALGGLLIARRFGGSAAVLACAILIASAPVQMQFAAGRIDHHNVQIALSMLMVAGAVHADTGWGPWLAGIATGLVLAVGLEPIVFAVLCGAAVALRFTADPFFASAMRRYAMSLGGTVILAFLAQTSPWLLLEPACDTLAINLTAGLAVAAAGLVAASFVTASFPARLVAVSAAGGAALGVCVLLDPACLQGPYAHMDARLYAEWLNHVSEVQNWPDLLRSRPELALALLALPLMAAFALVPLLRDTRFRRDPAWLIVSTVFIASFACGLIVVRMLPYAAAFATPIIAMSFACYAPRKLREGFVAAALSAFALSLVPMALAGIMLAFDADAAEGGKRGACTSTASFVPLAGLPGGLFLADIDIGPHLIVHTHHDALAAPYHRMNEGLASAHAIWSAPPDAAEAQLRRRGISYVMLCPARGRLPIAFPAGSLRAALEGGQVPGYLDSVPAGDAFKLWRLRSR